MSEKGVVSESGGAVGARRLIILRHGRTEWNATSRFQGQADIPLDEVGVAQAQEAALVLAGYGIDRIVSSDLSRARRTAQAVADRIGLPVELDPALREISVGSWEGLTVEELIAEDPVLGSAYARGEDVRRSATGETAEEVGVRAGEALRAQVARTQGDTLLAAMHGLAGVVGMAHFLGLPYRDTYHFRGLDNCHWIDLVVSRHGVWRIQGFNIGARGGVTTTGPVGAPGTRPE